MDHLTRRLLVENIEKNDLQQLQLILESKTTDFQAYRAVQNLLNEQAPKLDSKHGYVLQPGRFMFQELVYLHERERVAKLLEEDLNQNNFSPLEKYLGKQDVRSSMIVFESLCLFRLKNNLKKVAYWLHFCMQQLYAIREIDLLLEMVYAAYSSSRFWSIFAEKIIAGLDQDFIHFAQDAKAVLAIQRLGYYPILDKLNPEQSTLLLPFLKSLSITNLLKEYASVIVSSFTISALSWLQERDWQTFAQEDYAQVSALMVKHLKNWDILLQHDWPATLYINLLQALKAERQNIGAAFYKELKSQLEAALQ